MNYRLNARTCEIARDLDAERPGAGGSFATCSTRDCALMEHSPGRFASAMALLPEFL